MDQLELKRPHGANVQLAEVWGDIVSRSQLGKAVAIGSTISIAVYLVGNSTIAPLASNPAVGKALAMLAGVVGSLVSGAVCAVAFPPKRRVTNRHPSAATWQTEILEHLEQEGGPMGRVADLPPAVAGEMREVGLYDVFRDFERARNEIKENA